MFFGPKSSLGHPRVDCICHFGHFGARSKNRRFWDGAPGGQKIDKNQPLERHGPPGMLRESRGGRHFAGRGPWGASLKTIGNFSNGAEEQLVQGLTSHGPMARRI